MDEILSEASRLAASFTDYTGIAFKAGSGKVRISKFETVYLGPRDFLLVIVFSGDIVKAKPVHLGFSISRDDLTRFTEAANIYLVNMTAESISMPVIVKLEAIMGSAGAMVHPAVKLIYETMNELDTADVKLDGVNKLLQYPEYSDVSKLQRLIGMLEEKDKLLDVISSHEASDDGINVYIGKENDSDVMANTTLIFKNINVGGKRLSGASRFDQLDESGKFRRRDGRQNFQQAQAAALLRRFENLAFKAFADVRVEFDVGAFGVERNETADAEFGQFFERPFLTVAFRKRDDRRQRDVRLAGVFAGFQDGKLDPFFRDRGNFATVFFAGSVEERRFVADFLAQNLRQVARFGAGQNGDSVG
jgi:hypothetical protein